MIRLARTLGGLAVGGGLSAAGSLAGSAMPMTVELSADTVLVRVDGEVFTAYHPPTEGRPRPYLHPVVGPGGLSMTRDWPVLEDPRATRGEARDHPHHTSAWFAHGAVNGHDFWHGTAAVQSAASPPRAWLQGGDAVVAQALRWADEDGRTVCSESRTMRMRARPDRREIDFEIVLRAPKDRSVRWGDTKEGTMAVRVAPELRVRGPEATATLRNAAGDRDGDVWGTRSRWIDCSGAMDGRDVGVTLFGHPENPRHPTWWHARTYGLLAANPFGVRAFEGEEADAGDLEIPPGETVCFRYRLIFHDGGFDTDRIEKQWKQWVRSAVD